MAETTDKQSPLDEAKLGRALLLGIPLVAIVMAALVGVLMNAATAILVLIGAALLGVIAILWASLRVLSGDAPLPPELEALEGATRGVDALAARKKMLIRAIKDLENERDLGKLEQADFDQLSETYREELKTVLKQMDESLAPHRGKAEQIAREHLQKVGLAEKPYRGEPPPPEEKSAEEKTAERRVCPKCDASNEPDAKFCKECATSLLDKTDDRTAEASDEA
jgi:ribosomal protein L40E